MGETTNTNSNGAARLVTAIGLLLLTPWQLLLAMGVTFTFREHESAWAWLFVWTAFLLDIPALLVGLIHPKVGTVWLALNTVASAVQAAVFFASSGMKADASSPSPGLLGALFFQLSLLWGPKLVVITALVLTLRVGRHSPALR